MVKCCDALLGQDIKEFGRLPRFDYFDEAGGLSADFFEQIDLLCHEASAPKPIPSITR